MANEVIADHDLLTNQNKQISRQEAVDEVITQLGIKDTYKIKMKLSRLISSKKCAEKEKKEVSFQTSLVFNIYFLKLSNVNNNKDCSEAKIKN